MTTIAHLPTANEAWGLYGSICYHTDPGEAWAAAFPAVQSATGASGEGVRVFLDSQHGRHFADDVANELFAGRGLPEAVDRAVARWMGWTIGRRTSRETGIPQGLPYLTGLVTDCEILAEAA